MRTRVNASIRQAFRSISYNFLKALTNLTYTVRNPHKKIPILVYHRVCPLFYKKSIPYANVFPEEFNKQMVYLKDRYEPITISEYIRRIDNDQIIGNEACITFDDGFKDNYLYAFPILKRYELKATIFLITKYIGSNEIFPFVPLDKGAKKDILENRERWLPLSWQEVKEMSNCGIEFATHTHTHESSLTDLSIEGVLFEIEKCTEVFKKITGKHPLFFSYPHGTFKDYKATHIEVLKSHNYRAAFTTNIGRNRPSESLYELKRIIIYENDSLWEFKKKVSGAYDMLEILQKMWLSAVGTAKYKDINK